MSDIEAAIKRLSGDRTGAGLDGLPEVYELYRCFRSDRLLVLETLRGLQAENARLNGEVQTFEAFIYQFDTALRCFISALPLCEKREGLEEAFSLFLREVNKTSVKIIDPNAPNPHADAQKIEGE